LQDAGNRCDQERSNWQASGGTNAKITAESMTGKSGSYCHLVIQQGAQVFDQAFFFKDRPHGVEKIIFTYTGSVSEYTARAPIIKSFFDGVKLR
jgi:hypothetical protein